MTPNHSTTSLGVPYHYKMWDKLQLTQMWSPKSFVFGFRWMWTPKRWVDPLLPQHVVLLLQCLITTVKNIYKNAMFSVATTIATKISRNYGYSTCEVMAFNSVSENMCCYNWQYFIVASNMRTSLRPIERIGRELSTSIYPHRGWVSSRNYWFCNVQRLYNTLGCSSCGFVVLC